VCLSSLSLVEMAAEGDARKRKDHHLHEEEEPLRKKPKGHIEGEVDELILLLSRLTVDNLAPHIPLTTKTTYWKGIVTAHRDDTLADALTKCSDNNILSLPVLKKDSKYFGFVDMLDLVYAISSIFPEVPVDAENAKELLQTHIGFKKLTVGEIMAYPYSKRNPYHPIRPGYSLLHAVEVLAREDAHRVPVVNRSEKITNIITQSMVFDLIADHTHFMAKTVLETTVRSLIDQHHIPSKLLKVNSTTLAIDAFKKMAENHVSALPVVDSEGHLVNVLSIRDLRAIMGGTLFSRLWSSVEDYKTLAHDDFRKSTPDHLIVVTPFDTFGDVIRILRSRSIHRVVVVDNKTNLHPISVISLGDVLRFIFYKMSRLNTVLVESEES
jgi:CBS domain-containing protein